MTQNFPHRDASDRDGPEQGSPGSNEHRKQDRPGYHDPLFEIGGAAPAQSPLTLRLVLAVFGLLFATFGVIAFLLIKAPIWVVVLLVLIGLTALVDIIVVALRKHHGERG